MGARSIAVVGTKRKVFETYGMRILVLAAVLVASTACSGPTCDAPTRTIYTCEPLAAGSAGCIGGPQWGPIGTSNTDYQDDPEKVFPRDCAATVPDCRNSEPRRFACFSSDGVAFFWSEAL